MSIITSIDELKVLESELKRATTLFNYDFPIKQTKEMDTKTNKFVYQCEKLDDFLTDLAFLELSDLEKTYTIARWYNFQSSRGFEGAFVLALGATKNADDRQKFVDFSLYGRNYDLKTSVFPRALKNDESWLDRPYELTEWMYANQSQSSRHSNYNRIFVVVHNRNGQHWKVKAEPYQLYLFLSKYKNEIRQTMFWLKLPDGRNVHTNLICFCR